MSFSPSWILLFGLIGLGGCGYVGAPLPPALNIPSTITDMSAIEHMDEIVIRFTIPRLTTEGLVLRNLGEVELRGGPRGGEPFDWEEWVAGSQRLDAAVTETGPVTVRIPAREWIGQEMLFRVRVFNDKGRMGDWSNVAVLRVVPPLERPSGLRAVSAADGVRLTWETEKQQPGLEFRVYRSLEGGASASMIALAQQCEWVDADVRYDAEYTYTVQAVVKTGDSTAESEISPPAALLHEDRFPPAVPAGLKVVAGTRTIGLAWEQSPESDFAGYRVYRSKGDGPSERITGLLRVPSYTDRDIEPGGRYRYSVTVEDRLGNESRPSEPASTSALQ